MKRSEVITLSSSTAASEEFSQPRATQLTRGAISFLNRRFAGISEKEASFEVRRFRVSNAEAKERLEMIGRLFLAGYNAALKPIATSQLFDLISSFEGRYQGFVVEGASMGRAVADAMPWAKFYASDCRLPAFMSRCADLHPYLASVGIGWALARIPWRRRDLILQLDPLLVSLGFDGWGFHDVYFCPERLLKPVETKAVSRLGGDNGLQAWHQGAGRALWFVAGGNFKVAAHLILESSERYRGSLFAGLGLAMTYAAGSASPDLDEVSAVAGPYLGHLMQGAAFAMEAHARASTTHRENEAICHSLTRRKPNEVVDLVRAKRPVCDKGNIADDLKAYASWRDAVATELSKTTGGAQQ